MVKGLDDDQLGADSSLSSVMEKPLGDFGMAIASQSRLLHRFIVGKTEGGSPVYGILSSWRKEINEWNELFYQRKEYI